MKYQFFLALLISGGLAARDTETGTTGASDHKELSTKCEAAVAAEANVTASDAKAVSTYPTDSGTLTTVSLRGALAFWNCRADATGNITGVKYSEEG